MGERIVMEFIRFLGEVRYSFHVPSMTGAPNSQWKHFLFKASKKEKLSFLIALKEIMNTTYFNKIILTFLYYLTYF